MSELSRRNVLFGAFGLAGLATVSACGGATAVPSTAESVRRAQAVWQAQRGALVVAQGDRK